MEFLISGLFLWDEAIFCFVLEDPFSVSGLEGMYVRLVDILVMSATLSIFSQPRDSVFVRVLMLRLTLSSLHLIVELTYGL